MNKTIDALKLAENTLEDIIRVYKFETGTPVTTLAAIREALADQFPDATKKIAKHVEQDLISVLTNALEALVYHTEQTRPIHKTNETISQIKNFCKVTHINLIKHTTADNYEHFLSYMHGAGARHSAFLCKAYFDGSDAPHDEYEAYMTVHPEPVKQEPVAWDLAEKVRRDLDRQSCPCVYMNIAFESIVKNYAVAIRGLK